MLIVATFGAIWTAAIVLSFWKRVALRTSCALFVNWLAQVIYYHLTTDSAPWLFLFALDSVTAFVILLPEAGKAQAVIGFILKLQIGMHISYGLFTLWHGYSYPAAVRYWQILLWGAFAQAVLMGGWFGAGPAKRCLDWLGINRGKHPLAHDLSGVDR